MNEDLFIDTSAILALMDAGDSAHEGALEVWSALVGGEHDLVTTSNVLLETYALLQSRKGLAAVRLFRDSMAEELDVVWIDEALHHEALARHEPIGRRRISLVDAASFVVMEARGLDRAFAFDVDFRDQGFRTLPLGGTP